MDTETVHYGLIAQEVKEAMSKHNADNFTGWLEDEKGRQEISKDMFVIPLMKAVQELSAEVEELKTKIGEA